MSSYVLGLDLGSASIGWAIVEPNKKVIDCGVRIFDPGVNLEMFNKGQEGSSNNLVRRMARLHRRQLRRRAARQRDLFELLQQHSLLPGTATRDSQQRHDILQQLDSDLRAAWSDRLTVAGVPEQSLIYLLRKQALDARLEPFELGRVLYHLAQRRGFKSNRRDTAGVGAADGSKAKPGKTKDEASVVKDGIKELRAQMDAAGSRTLGEHFATLSAASQIVRRHWTDRKWFIEEFEAIWQAQVMHHGALTPDLKQQVFRLLFFQRPIATNAHLIGKCELEPGEYRAPMANLLAQRFRYLQKLNDIAIDDVPKARPLTSEQRAILLTAFECQPDLTFNAIRKLLGFDKSVHFNLERGGEKKLPGNRTSAAMLRAIPQLWPALSDADKDAIVVQWIEANDDEDLVARLTTHCALSLDDAAAICTVHPEDRYHNVSLLAMSRLLPLMEQGIAFKTAEDSVYGQRFSGGKPLDRLPPAKDVLASIPNPAVMRALSELRKVVNAIVQKHGKPAQVRIELARDLKRNAKQREFDWRRNRDRESERTGAAKRILDEAHRPNPSQRDIERVLLFKECHEICVYCGQSINFQRLFEGDIDVDHILPQSRFPDDSFANKCLAHRGCNQLKLGRTPFGAFGSDEELWPRIINEVKKWNNQDKLERFLLQDDGEFDPERETSFAARRLNDTRYVSKLAARYVGMLYGGRDVPQPNGPAKRVVFASTGMLTASLRRNWGLGAILRDAEPAETSRKSGKPRTDHRHHAIDAIVIALTSNTVIQQASSIAGAASYSAADRALARVPAPWCDFVPSTRPAIERMVVSHRPSHKLFGALHEETNYSDTYESSVAPKKGKKAKTVTHVRKPVHLLRTTDDIVDKAVRRAVEEKLREVGGDFKKLEKDCPMLTTRTGKQVPIRRVRIEASGKFCKIGRAERTRFVAPAGNHHVAIFEVQNKKGSTIWYTPGVVSRLDLVRAKGPKRRPGVKSNLICKQLSGNDEANFVFALMGGDMVRMDHPAHPPGSLFVVRTISQSSNDAIEVDFVRDRDARMIAEIKKDDKENKREGWVRARSIDALRQWSTRKVFVDVLGKVRG